MTREQSKQFLSSLGIENVTEEMITNHLNQINNAIKSERDRADKFKLEADRVGELQKQLDEINSKGLSDVEKANKATEQANAKIAELERSLKKMQTQKELAELNIVGEEAESLFAEDGSLNFQTLGQILTNREKAAATAKEKELAGNAGNPGGQGGASSTPEKTDDVKVAESYAKRAVESNKATSDALASYLK